MENRALPTLCQGAVGGIEGRGDVGRVRQSGFPVRRLLSCTQPTLLRQHTDDSEHATTADIPNVLSLWRTGLLMTRSTLRNSCQPQYVQLITPPASVALWSFADSFRALYFGISLLELTPGVAAYGPGSPVACCVTSWYCLHAALNTLQCANSLASKMRRRVSESVDLLS